MKQLQQLRNNFSAHTIGILGGMGPAATANFQRLLVAEINAAGAHDDSSFPTIITLSVPLSDWDNRGATNKVRVEDQIRRGLDKLRSFGAEIIAVPCNTVHEFIFDSDVVDIIDETLSRCASAKALGVLCSKQTRDSRLYERDEKSFLYYADQDTVDLVIGRVMEGKRPDIGPLIENLRLHGADIVVLGCTELSLCQRNPFQSRVVDSSKALAEGLVERLKEFL